jgi:hypothetical protein
MCGTIPATSVTRCLHCQPVWQRLHFLSLSSSVQCGTLEKAASVRSYVRVADAVLTSTHLQWSLSCVTAEEYPWASKRRSRTVERVNSVWTTCVGVEARLRDGGPGTEGSIRGRGKDFYFLNNAHINYEKGPSLLTRICGEWSGRGVTLVIHLHQTLKVRMRGTKPVISHMTPVTTLFSLHVYHFHIRQWVFVLMAGQPLWAKPLTVEASQSLTTTLGRTPLNEWSLQSRKKPQLDNTQHSQERHPTQWRRAANSCKVAPIFKPKLIKLLN